MEGTLIEPQTPPGTVADLGKKVKAKYPGTYDALPDDEVGRRVKAKYPDAYGGFVDVTTQPQTPPTAPFASAPPQAPPSVSGPTSEQQSFERDFKTTGTVSTAPRGEPSVGVSAQPPEPSSTAYALPAENDPIVAQRQKLLDTAPPGLLAQDPKWQGELVDIARFGQVDTQPVFRQFSQVGTVLSDTDPRMQKIMADYAAYGPGKVYSAPEIQARKAAGAWTAKDQARFEQGAIDHQRRVLEGRMLMVSKVLDSGELSNEDVAGDVADIQHGFDYLDHAQTELALRDKDSFSDRLRKAQQARTDAGHGLDATDAQVIAGLVGGTERTVVKPLLMAWNYLTKVDGQYTTTDAMIDAIDEASKDLDALVPTKSKEPVTKEGMNGGLKMVNPGNIIPQLAGASANMAPFLAVGGVGGSAGMALGLGERFGSTAALFGTTYADSYDRFVKDAIEAGSTQSVAEEYAPFAATIEATLMSVNPAATGRSLFGTSVRNSMLESIKDGLTPRTAMRKALDGAMKAGVGGLEMSGLVLATDASKNVVNRAVNEVSGSDLPEKASGEDIANSVMQAFLMGAVFNVGHQIVAPNVKGDAMHMAIMNPEATAAMFSKAAERGDIKPEQAAELAEKFNRMQLIYHGNDLLKEDPETAYKVASRLYEKQENERSLKEAPPDKTILEAKGDPRVARNEEIDKENLKDLGLKLPGETSKPSLGDPTGIVYEATSPQSWRTDDPIDLDQAELDLDLTEARIKKGIYRKGDFARTEFGMRLSLSAVSDVESALETNPEGAIAEIRDAIDKKRSSAVNEQVQEAPTGAAPAGPETAAQVPQAQAPAFKRPSPAPVETITPLEEVGVEDAAGNTYQAQQYAIPGFEEYELAVVKDPANEDGSRSKGYKVIEQNSKAWINPKTHPTPGLALQDARERMSRAGKEKLDQVISQTISNFVPDGEQATNPSPEPSVGATEGISGQQQVSEGGNGSSNFRVDPIARGREFYSGLERVHQEHRNGKAVEVKDPAFYQDPDTKLFMAPDGSAGAAVTADGDLVSVFEVPGSTADIAGILSEASQHAKTLDAYDINGFLPTLYSAFGFRPVARVRFNDEYAPSGWSYDDFGRPDVVLMAKTGSNEVVNYASVRDNVPVFDDYGDAAKVQGEAIAGSPQPPSAPAGAPTQAEGGKEPQPLSAKSIEEAFGVTPEVAQATEAIADAMGLDKSKISVVKGGTPEANALFQDRANAEVAQWYSRLDKAVAAKGNTQSGADWMRWAEARAKEGALSMEEVKWTGLADFLEGKKKVTPQEVREFLKENRVKVEVKELDAKTDYSKEEVADYMYGRPYEELRDFEQQSVDMEYAARQAGETSRDAGEPRFSQYQLPGGTNYREVLVTLPVKGELTIPDDWDVRNRNGRHEVYNASGALAATGNTRAEAIKAAQPFIPEWKKKRIARGQGAFVSSHFAEPNILVHLRLNDRTVDVPLTDKEKPDMRERERMIAERDKLAPAIRAAAAKVKAIEDAGRKKRHEEGVAKLKSGEFNSVAEMRDWMDRFSAAEGTPELAEWQRLQQEWSDYNDRMPREVKPRKEKVLFIEEWQSDFGQAGKKKGFAENDPFAAEYASLVKKNDALRTKARELQGDLKTEGEVAAKYPEEYAAIRKEADPIRQRLLEIEQAQARRSDAPPSAPFVTSTEGWVELGMKQAIRMAVEGGYDRIAWSTGEQQFGRWGSQAFAWSKGKTGWRVVAKEQVGGDAFEGMEEALAQEAKESDTIITSKEELRGVVEDVMGRERSDYSPENWKTHINKIVDGMWERMQNEDSGTTMPRREGMKGFYDKILPTVAKKVSKRLGGDGVVSEVAIGKLRDQRSDYGIQERPIGGFRAHIGDMASVHETWDDANAWINAQSGAMQQSISVTPEMRKKVMEGVPLMQGNKASVEFTQAGEAIIRALKNPDASTGIHELAHVARRFLFDNSIPKENRAGITDEHIHTAEKWSGAKDGKWGRDAEEKFARGFERYLRDGLAPNDSLRDLFAKFAKWLRDIYANLFSSPVKEMISPEMRKVYNALVSRSEVQNEPTTAEAPPPTQAPTAGAGVEQQSEPTPEVKKTVATKRAYEGDFRQEVKDEIEKGGLYRNVKNREETWKNVGEFVGKVGIGSALDAVRNGDIRGDNAAAVFAYAIKDVQDRRSKELDAEKWQQLVKDEAALVQESGDYALESGRYGSMMGFIYENTDLGFSAAKIADEWKRDFDQEPPPAVQDLMKQVEELRAKIDEANKKAAELEEKMAVEGIKESVKREGSKGQAAQRRAFADRIRSLKIKPQGVASSFIVPPQLFNAAVEAVALAVQTGESVASAITKGIKLIQQSDWYKNLSKSDQLGSEKSFEDSINGVVDESVTEGRISIPKSVIREEVKRGAEDIDALVERVKAKLGRKDVTDREVRDAITGYGRKVNMSKDEIDVEIRKQKRIGRLISALEDVRAQKRPAKNIVERDKIDAKEKALKAELKQAIKDLPPDLEADERKAKSSLEAAKTRALASIEELQRRLKEGDFAAKKGPGVTADAELRGLRTKMQQIREKYELEREKERRRRRNLRQKIYGALMDVLNVPKSLVSSLDFSAPLRQGVILSAGNPRAAMRAGKEMFAQAFSQEKADEWLANLKQTEDYKMMRDSGLYLAEPTMSMNAKEESFMSNLAEKIPIYGQLVKGSGRAYAGYLNKLRADVFMYGTERLRDQGITPENDPKSYTEWAHFINNATGRGRMHRNIESAAPLLNTLMFSPRYLASRVNLMNPVTYARMPKEARKMAMKNMISAIGFYAVVATMLAAGGADTEDDPESSDFGKLRFGNTRYDLMAGFQQLFVFFSRLLGHISRGEPVSDTVQRFARSKASPTVGTLINLDQGKDMVGDPVTLQSEAVKLALPLYVQDMKDVYDEGGATGVITSAVPAVFGVGVQTYKPRRRDSERSDPHETRPSR